ncbi:amidase signature enzyme [Dacryopinax primogenitus]|uniref:Amidase signature enzyme n=1 Tax=Dacryopinax primogenitus (strain DJM 731) TaxID=1858805 RepID=M5GES5_DACPD|nr:amidase signature enzyme [Dacryopinax primogenitus]EJU03543.1 amidase signature enzyme [Dacryopinax primogenitus]
MDGFDRVESGNNPVFGRTTNPYSPLHIPGGSSGGEAALLACGGSALGFGSDLAGSLRFPAHMSGCFSLKFGQGGRMSKNGMTNIVPTEGFEAVHVSVGPMARSIADLRLACQTLCGLPGGPGEIAPVPWREVILPKKLKVGYYLRDDFAEFSPPVKRALRECVAALEREGHECVEFLPPYALETMETFVALTSSDGYKQLTSHLGPDPQDPSMFLVLLGPKIPAIIRTMSCFVLRRFLRDQKFAALVQALRVKSVRDFNRWVHRRNELVQKFHTEVWEKYGFDIILGPVHSMPALPHNATARLSPLAGTAILYSILSLPAGVIPVTRVLPTDTWPEEPQDPGMRLLRGIMRQLYDPEKMAGLPIGVQVVGRPWEEEKLLEVMGLLDNTLGPRGFAPGSWTPPTPTVD